MFTHPAYSSLLQLIQDEGYTFTNYHNCESVEKPCILRHDVDFDIDKAVEMARLEASMQVRSTYFVLVRTPFYNVFLNKAVSALHEIQAMGHEIGLHFDEMQYTAQKCEASQTIANIEAEMDILQMAIGSPIRTVSMHRPSKETLQADLHIPGAINSYGSLFFSTYKYVSDSRMHWREDVQKIIMDGQYTKLHLLTHPFWYAEQEETTQKKLLDFAQRGSIDRYHAMQENFRDLNEYVKESDVKGE